MGNRATAFPVIVASYLPAPMAPSQAISFPTQFNAQRCPPCVRAEGQLVGRGSYREWRVFSPLLPK